jgi:hypothetical protein
MKPLSQYERYVLAFASRAIRGALGEDADGWVSDMTKILEGGTTGEDHRDKCMIGHAHTIRHAILNGATRSWHKQLPNPHDYETRQRYIDAFAPREEASDVYEM